MWRKPEGTWAEAHPLTALLGALSEGNLFSLLLKVALKLGLSRWSLPELCHSQAPHWFRSWPTSQCGCRPVLHCALGWQSLIPVTMPKPEYDLWSWLMFPAYMLQICWVFWSLGWTQLPSLALAASLGVQWDWPMAGKPWLLLASLLWGNSFALAAHWHWATTAEVRNKH